MGWRSLVNGPQVNVDVRCTQTGPERAPNGGLMTVQEQSHIYTHVAEHSCQQHAHRATSVRTCGLGGKEFWTAGTREIHCFRISECTVQIGFILIGGAA